MSFPPGTEMFQFPGFASLPYGFRQRYRRSGGLPHSEIHGSKLVRSSPWLIAAYHVLHRLSAPRHPPDALRSLDCSHHQCPSEDGIDAELLVYINVRLVRRTPTLRPDFHRDRPNSRRFNTADLGGGFLHNNSRCCGRRKSQVDPLFTM